MHDSISCKRIKEMIGAISLIGTRWLYYIQICFWGTVQETAEITVCSVMQSDAGSFELYYFYYSGQLGLVWSKQGGFSPSAVLGVGGD